MAFWSILRKPDYVTGATEKTSFRFEEEGVCHIQYEYLVEGNRARVVVYPSEAPVKYLKLRWNGDLEFVEKVYGDQWERAGSDACLEWQSVKPSRALPWFCYLKGSETTACYGVKTGADCFAFWQVDTHGITLFCNLTCGCDGTDLQEPLTACEVVELIGQEGEDSYKVAKRFASVMCDEPVCPKEPVFGVNNWYWAYGRISLESVLQETDYLLQMCEGTVHKPYMIIDDGWQLNRTYDSNMYIGGPWQPNAFFGDMKETAERIHEKGAKAGLWFRPLLTMGYVPKEAGFYDFEKGGKILDASHPYTLERVEADAARIREWGYELIKHDFTTNDITGMSPLTSQRHTYELMNRSFYDKTRTTATIIKDLYKAIQRGAKDAEVIGCNTISHLTAGIHSIYRVGDDTSGRSFEWTRKHGVGSVMRLPLNDTFYRVDPDCAAFTQRVNAQLNLDFLEMCAVTGMTTLASVTPGILTDAEMKRINSIYKTADRDDMRLGIKNYDRNTNPDIFVSEDGKTEKRFRWDQAYEGARVVVNWFE